MRRETLFVSLAAWFGVASATPAVAGGRDLECPAMPPTANSSRSTSGGLSLQVGGFGLDGRRTRESASIDVMMREGGLSGWSAVAALSLACQLNRRIYPDDPRRQRDEFLALRDRLVSPGQPAPSQAQVSPVGARRRSSGWSFADLWQPLSKAQFMPRAAIRAGIFAGSADVDCGLNQRVGLEDCRVLSESPSGLGIGRTVLSYLYTLRLKPELRAFYVSVRSSPPCG